MSDKKAATAATLVVVGRPEMLHDRRPWRSWKLETSIQRQRAIVSNLFCAIHGGCLNERITHSYRTRLPSLTGLKTWNIHPATIDCTSNLCLCHSWGLFNRAHNTFASHSTVYLPTSMGLKTWNAYLETMSGCTLNLCLCHSWGLFNWANNAFASHSFATLDGSEILKHPPNDTERL